MSSQTEVWVVAESRGDELHSCTFELIAEGRAIAEKRGESLAGITIGHEVARLSAQLAESSVDLVYEIDAPSLEGYSSEAYAFVLGSLIRERQPSVVLLAATPHGADLAPRLAMSVDASLITNVVWAKPGDGEMVLELIKPLCEDKTYSTVCCRDRGPALVTFRPGSSGVPRTKSAAAPIETVAASLPSELRMARTVEFLPADPSEVSLPEADYIVAGGRGVGSAENWGLVEDLAEALGAAVGGSRMAVDLGWIPFHRQVGQTGQTVTPKVYLSLGISGASQHVGGIKNSKGMIAINNDRRAAIFKVANLRVLGDLHEIVPLLTSRLREITADPANGSEAAGAQPVNLQGSGA